VKKFFFQIMLVLVLAEVAMITLAWNQSYTRAYVHEAVTTNDICGCSSGTFQFDTPQVLIDTTWVMSDDRETPLLQGVWGSYPTDCWQTRATDQAWGDALPLIIVSTIVDLLIVLTAVALLCEGGSRPDYNIDPDA